MDLKIDQKREILKTSKNQKVAIIEKSISCQKPKKYKKWKLSKNRHFCQKHKKPKIGNYRKSTFLESAKNRKRVKT